MWRLHTSADLSPLAPLWQSAAVEHVFQRYELAAVWARVFASPAAPYRLRVWYWEDPPLLLPLAEYQSTLRWLGDGLWDYCDPLGDPAHFAWRELRPFDQPVRLHGIRESSRWWTWFQAQPLQLEYFCDAPCYRSASMKDGAAMEDGVTPDAARLDREHPRITERLDHLLRSGIEWAPVSLPHERQRLLAFMLRQKAARMAERGATNVIGRLEAAWLEEMSACHPSLCELWRLGPASQPWAGFLTWAQPDLRLGYTLSFDPLFARHSPGIKLLYAVLRRSLSEGRGFDFLTGSQAFKLRFANAAQRLWKSAPGIST